MNDVQKPSPAGLHIIADIENALYLDDLQFIQDTLLAAAEKAGLTVLDVKLHHFGNGQGITGVVLLAESHISIHTWPETGQAAVDIFVCAAYENAKASLDTVVAKLKGKIAQKHLMQRLNRF